MKDRIRLFALQNAIEHGGKASIGSVMGRAMSTFPDLKNDPRSASAIVKAIVEEVNSLPISRQNEEIELMGGPEERVLKARKTDLPELPDVGKNGVRMRFAPGPSGPLHIGHSRASILNDEYVKKYGGTFILRFEDTNPEKIEPDAYSMIPEDLKWLGIDIGETYVQSDRFDLYYDISRQMMERGFAYICTCDPEEWRGLKAHEKGCPHRESALEDNLEGWDRMLDGTYAEEKASLVVKTDLHHPNPAVRDFVAMRIKDEPHPLKGDRYRVYPLYNFSVAVDDHIMECTHILRGKDHLNNTLRQEFVYKHMGWPLPYFYHYGLVSIPETNLKKSLIKEALRAGRVRGWDDVRLGTLRALHARGIAPSSLRKYWTDVGVKAVDITFSWDNLASYNRQIIDPIAPRFFFVADPLPLTFYCDRTIQGRAPLHPDDLKKGFREYSLGPGDVRVMVSRDDIHDIPEEGVVRLKDLCNVRIGSKDQMIGTYSGQGLEDVREGRSRIIQWVPVDGIECVLRYPDGNDRVGLAEPLVGAVSDRGEVVQFERLGFFKLHSGDHLEANFAPR